MQMGSLKKSEGEEKTPDLRRPLIWSLCKVKLVSKGTCLYPDVHLTLG